MAAKQKQKNPAPADVSVPVKVRIQSKVLDVELEGREALLQKELPELMGYIVRLSEAASNRAIRLDLLDHTLAAQRLATALEASPKQIAAIAGQVRAEYQQLDEQFLKMLRVLNKSPGPSSELRSQVDDLIDQRKLRQVSFQIALDHLDGELQQIEQILNQLKTQQESIENAINKYP